MLEKLKFGTYIFLGAFCLHVFLSVFFFILETLCKSLEEMDLRFGGNSGTVDGERIQEVMAEIGVEPNSARICAPQDDKE